MKKIRIILMIHILFLEIMYTKYLLQVHAFLKSRGHFIVSEAPDGSVEIARSPSAADHIE